MLAWSSMVRSIVFVTHNPPLNSFVGVLTLLGYIVPLPPSRKEALEILSVSERSGWSGARLARASVTEYFRALLPNSAWHATLIVFEQLEHKWLYPPPPPARRVCSAVRCAGQSWTALQRKRRLTKTLIRCDHVRLCLTYTKARVAK